MLFGCNAWIIFCAMYTFLFIKELRSYKNLHDESYLWSPE